MNLIDEVKTLLAIRATGQQIYKEVVIMNKVPAGWHSTEFWMNIASQVGIFWGAVQGFIPPKYAAIISVSGIAVYTVARTILKASADIQTARGISSGKETATATATVQA